MKELGYHLMFRLDDDRVIAPSDAARRTLARTVYRVSAGFKLLAFGAADTHLHVVALCDRRRAGQLAQAIACALRIALALPVPFFPVRIKALEDQHHMLSAFHYVLSQRNRHGIHSDPFLDASSLPELLGMRLLTCDCVKRVREHLPRVSRTDLLRHLGPPQLEPGRFTPTPSVEYQLLRDAAAGALGLADLSRRTSSTTLARRTLVQCTPGAGGTGELAELIGRSPSQVRRLRQPPVPPRVAHALRLQLALRTWLLENHPEAVEPEPLCLPHGPGGTR